MPRPISDRRNNRRSGGGGAQPVAIILALSLVLGFIAAVGETPRRGSGNGGRRFVHHHAAGRSEAADRLRRHLDQPAPVRSPATHPRARCRPTTGGPRSCGRRHDCAFGEPLFAHPAAYDTQAGGLGISYATTPVDDRQSRPESASTSSPTPGTSWSAWPDSTPTRCMVDGWSDWTVTSAVDRRRAHPHGHDRTRPADVLLHGHRRSRAAQHRRSADGLDQQRQPDRLQHPGPRLRRVRTDRRHLDGQRRPPSRPRWPASPTSPSPCCRRPPPAPTRDRIALADSYGPYAHAHVTGTTVVVRLRRRRAGTCRPPTGCTTTPREGTETGTVVSLYPHQWKALADGTPIAQTYVSPRGAMKNLVGVNSFTTTHEVPRHPARDPGRGHLGGRRPGHPHRLPQPGRRQPGRRAGVDDTYWTGKGLGRAARIAEIADQLGEHDRAGQGADVDEGDPEQLAHRLARRRRSPLLLRPELGDPDRLRRQLRVRPGAQRSSLPLRLLHRRGRDAGQVRPGLGPEQRSTAA